MSTATLEQTETIHELMRGAVTVRVTHDDEGQTWLALDRENSDGTTASIGVPLDDQAIGLVHKWMSERWA